MMLYTNKIKLLVKLVGYRGYDAEIAAIMAFITGFPEEIAQKLQQVTAVDQMEMSELILTVKILTSSWPSKAAEVVVVSQKEERKEQLAHF